MLAWIAAAVNAIGALKEIIIMFKGLQGMIKTKPHDVIRNSHKMYKEIKESNGKKDFHDVARKYSNMFRK
jgi:hypothetical protein